MERERNEWLEDGSGQERTRSVLEESSSFTHQQAVITLEYSEDCGTAKVKRGRLAGKQGVLL